MGADRRTGIFDRHEELGIDKLVLEREHTHLAANAHERVGVLPVALNHTSGHGGGGLSWLTQHGNTNPERPRRQHGHLGQLPGASDADVIGGRTVTHGGDATSAGGRFVS